MERRAWIGRIKSGCKKEYIRRHDEIWPELLETFKAAGICNYTIFVNGNDLFGYYECEKGTDFADRVKAESDVVKRWNTYMQDILEIEVDPKTGSSPTMKQIFRVD